MAPARMGWLTLIVFSGLAAAQTGESVKGAYQRIKVHGKSLEGNLSGEPADRDVSVYLPPSYQGETSRRYPVVYLLHGYTNSDIGWFGPDARGSFANGNTMSATAGRAFTGGGVREVILVMPNAYTIYQGSMFSNSVTTGDWEAFIARDLVEYIDSRYRTIPERASRGLAGHSMGGYGTVRIAMKYPQVYSSIYLLSACCLTANLNPNPQNSAQAEALKSVAEAKGAERGLAALLAEAAAWSPNPQNPPFYFDLPAKDGKIQPAVVARWAANAPLAMVDQYASNLKKLRIGIDVGDKDNLAASNRELNRVLRGYGIETAFEVYDGDHTNHIADRMERNVLPSSPKPLHSLRAVSCVGRRLLAGFALAAALPLGAIDSREEVPRFRAKTLDGQTLSNDALIGKVVLLQFWTTWCPYCKRDQPVVDRFASEFRDQEFAVLGIDAGESKKNSTTLSGKFPPFVQNRIDRRYELGRHICRQGFPDVCRD
jgi:S-formylglutathione hydrolase